MISMSVSHVQNFRRIFCSPETSSSVAVLWTMERIDSLRSLKRQLESVVLHWLHQNSFWRQPIGAYFSCWLRLCYSSTSSTFILLTQPRHPVPSQRQPKSDFWAIQILVNQSTFPRALIILPLTRSVFSMTSRWSSWRRRQAPIRSLCHWIPTVPFQQTEKHG